MSVPNLLIGSGIILLIIAGILLVASIAGIIVLIVYVTKKK